MVIVDGDTHYWPTRMLERVTHPGKGEVRIYDGAADYIRDGKAIWERIPESRWSLEKRYAIMDREGFDLQVLIPDNRPLPYELEPDLGCQLAIAYNDTVAEDIAGYDRFIGVAWVYLPNVDASVREVRRAVEELGLQAVKVMGAFGDLHLSDRRLWPFYEEVERLDIPMLVHPVAGVAQNRFFATDTRVANRPDLLGVGALGLPFEYMAEVARLVFSGVFDEFPTLRIGFFEGGVGWVPFLMNRLDHSMLRGHEEEPNPRQTLSQGPENLLRKPSEYFEQIYVAAVSWETYLPEILALWPNHNVIIGSDYDHGDAIATWPRTIEGLDNIPGLSPEDRRKILSDNASRLFGFDRHPERLPSGRARTSPTLA